jgi:hypothetical protein
VSGQTTIDHYDRAQTLLEQLEPERLSVRRPHVEATIAVGHALLAIAHELRRLRGQLDRSPTA